MSLLLDDVSIVVTPNGYKAGELYAVVPVPTLGSEEVINGDFATDSDWNNFSTPTTSEQSTEQSHTGTYSWKVIADATQEGIFSPNNFSITNGNSYSVSLWIYSVSGNSIKSGLNNTNVSVFTERTVIAGQWTNITYEATATSTGASYISILSQNSLNFYVDDVSVKEYTSADMDVTRATAATRVDENGLVNYALGVEEVTNGDFSNGSTDWTPFGSTFVVSNANPYNGNDTALFTASGVNGAKVTQSITTVVGNTYHLSCYAQYNSGDQTQIEIAGVLEYPNGIGITSGITTFTYLQTSFTATSTTSVVTVRERGGNNNASCYLYGLSVKEVNNVPRIDYTGGGCPHILAEPQRTNTVTYSEDFSQYSSSGTTPTLTTGQLAPDGTLGATKISGAIGSSVLWLPSVTSPTDVRSIYARTVSGTGTARLLSYYGNTNNTFNLTEEWQRFELTSVTTTSGESNFYIDLRGSQTLSEFIVWGGQCEVGSYATSYIPTSGSTVTRNQDIFTRDGIGSLINSTEGVLFAEIAALSDNDGTYRSISISDSSRDNEIEIDFTNDEKIRVLVKSGGGTIFSTSFIIDTTLFNKVAVKYKLNDFAVFINGTEEYTLTSGAIPIGLNRLAFDRGDGGTPFYAKVKQLQVYNTALTDEQLLQLTGESGTDFYESYAEMAAALTYTIQ